MKTIDIQAHDKPTCSLCSAELHEKMPFNRKTSQALPIPYRKPTVLRQALSLLAGLSFMFMLSACSDDDDDENGNGGGSGVFGGGAGTAASPYQIETIAHLNNIRDNSDDDGENYLDDHFILENDLDFSSYTYEDNDKGWLPLGHDGNAVTFGFQGTAFTGSFDGDDNVIKNIKITRGGENYIGLFGHLDGGTIENLGLEGGSITGQTNVGGLVGENLGEVSDSYSTGRVSGSGDNSSVGGLVGLNYGTVSNSYATGAVTGSSEVGGLVGVNFTDGTISTSYATGMVSASGFVGFVGGLVGRNSGGPVSNSYSTGRVSGSGESSDVGGLVGVNEGPVSNSYSTGRVSGSGESSDVGGLVGVNGSGLVPGGTVSNSYSTGAVSGTGNVGGLVGANLVSTVENSYSTGTVSSSGEGSSVGGLVGVNSSGGTVSNSYATGVVSASGDNSNVGGLVGANSEGTVSNSYWNTMTSGQTEGIGNNSGAATGVEGYTTAEMYVQGSYVSWDFTMIWNAPTASTFPTLRGVGGQQ